MDNQYVFWSLEGRFCGNNNLTCRRSFTSGQWCQLDWVTAAAKTCRKMKRLRWHLRRVPSRSPAFSFLGFLLCTSLSPKFQWLNQTHCQKAREPSHFIHLGEIPRPEGRSSELERIDPKNKENIASTRFFIHFFFLVPHLIIKPKCLAQGATAHWTQHTVTPLFAPLSFLNYVPSLLSAKLSLLLSLPLPIKKSRNAKPTHILKKTLLSSQSLIKLKYKLLKRDLHLLIIYIFFLFAVKSNPISLQP